MGTVCHSLSHALCLRAPVDPEPPGLKQDTPLGGSFQSRLFTPGSAQPPAAQGASGQSKGPGPGSAGEGCPDENAGPGRLQWGLPCWPRGWRPRPGLLSPGGPGPKDVSQAGTCKAVMPRSAGSGDDPWAWTSPQVPAPHTLASASLDGAPRPCPSPPGTPI